MAAYKRVRSEAKEAEKHSNLYRGNASTDTYASLVSSAFDDVSKTMNNARHCSYYEMYHPPLGEFRNRKMYTTLAPSLCIKTPDRRLRSDVSDYATHNSYNPKRGEWIVEKSKNRLHTTPPRYPFQPTTHMDPLEPAGPSRYYTVPASNTRYENFALYSYGKERGVRVGADFLNYEDYAPMEDRRYHRLFWAPEFIDLVPSCRHGRSLMLSAY